ncbi:MAG TPA: hypothetical protein VKB53_12575, partial [Gammaproteobacteria bacterium]|nr:hypothetical protein [Gammaproteobacteria bacterium]
KKIPADQSQLKIEVERTLDVLRPIFAPDHPKFHGYFDELLGLSRYGLVGPTAQPNQAMDSLRTLQARILDSEKGTAISAHMRGIIISQTQLLIAAAIALTACVYVAVYFGAATIQNFNIVAVIPGLWIGLVFSSFVRCRAITFYDLHAIDADRFSPLMKSAFALVVLVLIAILLKAGIFEVAIGKVKLSGFENDWLSAFVFGAIIGIAQEAAIARIESIKRQVFPSARSAQSRAKPQRAGSS